MIVEILLFVIILIIGIYNHIMVHNNYDTCCDVYTTKMCFDASCICYEKK